MDARANLEKIANQIDPSGWQSLEREPKYKVKTWPRRRPSNVKQQVVKKRKFKRITTTAEDVTDCQYQPGKCKKPYRLIILRKTVTVLQGELNLFEDIRYLFYITNDRKRSTEQMIHFIVPAAIMKMTSNS